MKYVEYGREHSDTIILLHGGGLSWWNYREVASLLPDCRVILPILDGHAGSDRPFTTIGDNAREIIAFIDEHLGGRVLIMGGLSLGGQILLEILARRGDICRYALVESAPVIPSRILHTLIPPAFGSCFGLIRRRWFARLQFQSLHMKPALFEDYFRDTCALTRPDMIAFLQANALYALPQSLSGCSAQVHIFAGEKENASVRRSAHMIHHLLPGSGLHMLPGLHHGEFSIHHPEDYAAALREITGA